MKIELILPQFPTNRKEKRGIVTLVISGFIGLAYEGISCFLHKRRHKAVKGDGNKGKHKAQ